jgi:PKHD-type hydroxylase
MNANPNPYAYLQPFAVWENAFSPAELDTIVATGDALPLQKAGVVYTPGQSDNDAGQRVTRTAWMARTPETGWLYDRIERIVRVLNLQIYQFELAGFSEPFQYAVYHASEGGHFDWHLDQIPNGAHRKLSFSLQLSDAGDYEGCDLEIHGGRKVLAAPRTRGALIAFPAYAMHRVTPIRSGVRRALVIWTAGPPFR